MSLLKQTFKIEKKCRILEINRGTKKEDVFLESLSFRLLKITSAPYTYTIAK